MEEEDILMQRKMGLKMGSTKNGCVAKVLKKPQGSKKILREMDEGRLRSLEKCIFLRRNGEMKKKNQVEEEGE